MRLLPTEVFLLLVVVAAVRVAEVSFFHWFSAEVALSSGNQGWEAKTEKMLVQELFPYLMEIYVVGHAY